ncbi:hypothetical protein SAMN05421780_11044 [Flexibacter flexilis DSM 6793]|uniref:Uncharacterized protein n=1 Tax=Flexibacter flexilis DSM 6793 TaxID=927664 RepID=A0A1I1MGU9_9BACT|nr:hypothetical protein [Flexibacter flexilis]SFC80800.1 hypothetical protein SAMN05421780_11044 [Flexibacter flexilis DSM 6793]
MQKENKGTYSFRITDKEFEEIEAAIGEESIGAAAKTALFEKINTAGSTMSGIQTVAQVSPQYIQEQIQAGIRAFQEKQRVAALEDSVKRFESQQLEHLAKIKELNKEIEELEEQVADYEAEKESVSSRKIMAGMLSDAGGKLVENLTPKISNMLDGFMKPQTMGALPAAPAITPEQQKYIDLGECLCIMYPEELTREKVLQVINVWASTPRGAETIDVFYNSMINSQKDENTNHDTDESPNS